MKDILQKEQGTYVAVNYDRNTKTQLRDWFKKVGLRDRVRIESIHTTLLYSRKPVLRAFDLAGPRTIVAKPANFQLFDSENGHNDVLILGMLCHEFDQLHDDLINMGGTHDHPEYNPHVTLSFNPPDDHEWIEQLPVPDFPFVTTEIFVEPLNLDWKNK
jgi:hypothetical protein